MVKKFGGVFMNCSGSSDPNAMCAKFNECPVGYYPIRIHSFTNSTAQYNAYWCVPSSDTNNYFFFGGFYTTLKANPPTGVKGCPNYFFPQRWTLGPDEDTFICVSSDVHGPHYATFFGGFESCEAGNPFIVLPDGDNIGIPKTNPHGYPLGFTKYPIIFDDGCGIYVCLVLDSSTSIQALLPPFHNYPKVSPRGVVANILIGVDDVWKKDSNGQWVNTGNGSNITTVNGASASSATNLSDLPSAVIAVTSVFITLILGAIVVFAFIGLCAVKGTKRREHYHSIGYLSDTTATKTV